MSLGPDWLRLRGVTRNNVHDLGIAFPKGVFTTVTGVSGSGKSGVVSQALVGLVAQALGSEAPTEDAEGDRLEIAPVLTLGGEIVAGMEGIKRLVRVVETHRADPALQPGDLYRRV